MQIDQSPVFRKAVVPWYDSNTACAVIVIAMIIVFLFAVSGIRVALHYSEYHDYIWVPSLIAALSLMVFISTLIRCILRRYSEK